MVESAVTLNGSRYLETRGAQQPDSLADFAVEWNHHLRPQENVVACPAACGVGDVVSDEVIWPERSSGQAERGTGDLIIHQNQPVRDHRSGADRTEEWVCVHYLDAEIRPRLCDWRKAISKPLQIVNDVRAVTEQKR